MEKEPQLVADVGATNARFAALESGGRRSVVLPTADFSSADELLRAAMAALELEAVRGGCIAVAGPVHAGVGVITNGGLRFEEAGLGKLLGTRVHLVNDFYALAMAVPRLKGLLKLGGQGDAAGPRVVLGPGSGLGVAFLLPDGERWRVVPSEAGHADLAPGNLLEVEVLGMLHQQTPAGVCWEHVLSGPGLARLHGAVSALWGGAAEALSPEEIVTRGRNAEDPICHQTLELFLGWLGSAAGNLALTLCARGGVYIGGGIVPRLEDLLADSPLRRRFDERAELEEMVRPVPLYVITEENPGLLGAEACLAAAEQAAGSQAVGSE